MELTTWSRPINQSPFDVPVAYWSLIVFTFIMFTAPQFYVPALIPLRLALLSALLASTAYVLAALRQSRQFSIWSVEVKLVAWLLAFAFLSIPLSMWPGGSYEFLFDIYIKSIVIFFLIANLMTSERRLSAFLWMLTICCAFNGLIGINDYLMGSFSAGRIKGGDSGLTANPNDLALTLNLIIPFMWYLAKSTEKQLQKSVAMACLIISVIAIILSFSRGGAVTLITIVLFMIWSGPRRNRIPAFLMALFIVAIVVVFGLQGYSDRLTSAADFSKDDGSASARWQMILVGLRQTVEHPFGAGLGMNNLVQVEQGIGWNMVHNVYLEISTELGIVPAVLFIVLLGKLISGMRQIQDSERKVVTTHSSLARATQVSLLAFAVAAMFHPVAYNFYFYIVAGIALALKELSKEKAQSERQSGLFPWQTK